MLKIPARLRSQMRRRESQEGTADVQVTTLPCSPFILNTSEIARNFKSCIASGQARRILPQKQKRSTTDAPKK